MHFSGTFSGVHTPIVTPFADDGTIDFETLEKVVAFQLDNGIAGLIPCGSTGEFYALDLDERLEVMRFIAGKAKGRCVLTAGTNATTTKDVIAYSRAAERQGFDAIMLAPPYYSLPSQDELLAHFQAVLDAVDIPLVLYNFPGRAGVEIGFDVLDGLADHPQCVAIKESSGDINRLHDIRQRYAGSIQLICGGDDQAYEYAAWGIEAWICGAANPLPAQNVAVMASAAAGDLAGAKAAMDKLMPFMQTLEGGKYIQGAKYAMELAGIPCGPTRPPLLGLTADEKMALAAVYEQAAS